MCVRTDGSSHNTFSISPNSFGGKWEKPNTSRLKEKNWFKSKDSLAFSLAELRVLDKVMVPLSISIYGLCISVCWPHSSRLFPEGRKMTISMSLHPLFSATPVKKWAYSCQFFSKKGPKGITGLSLVTWSIPASIPETGKMECAEWTILGHVPTSGLKYT